MPLFRHKNKPNSSGVNLGPDKQSTNAAANERGSSPTNSGSNLSSADTRVQNTNGPSTVTTTTTTTTTTTSYGGESQENSSTRDNSTKSRPTSGDFLRGPAPGRHSPNAPAARSPLPSGAQAPAHGPHVPERVSSNTPQVPDRSDLRAPQPLKPSRPSPHDTPYDGPPPPSSPNFSRPGGTGPPRPENAGPGAPGTGVRAAARGLVQAGSSALRDTGLSSTHPTSARPDGPGPSAGGSDGDPGQPMRFRDAARGIHGAADTFRGTLNAAVDRRLGEPDDTVARHQAVADQGRRETQDAQAGRRKAEPGMTPQAVRKRNSGEVGRGLPRVDEATAYI